MGYYFVDAFDTTAKRAALIWARDDYDSHDQWGWAMSWLFDLCAELYERNAGWDAIRACEYHPGMGGPVVSEDRAEGLALFTDEALEHAAMVLQRYETRCRAAGLSY